MGAGRGQARRARSVAWFDTRIWDKFLKEQGLRNQTLNHYYGVNSTAPGYKYLQEDEAMEVITQLFYDFVSTGALTLPDGCSITDYEVICEANASISGSRWKQAFLSKRGGGKRGIISSSVDIVFSVNTKLDSYETERMLLSIADALRMTQ
jgi:hypothetical protein